MSFFTRDSLAEGIARHGWRIGAHTYGAPKVYRWGGDGGLEIGAYTSIANGVEILLGGNHRTDWVTTYPFNAIRKSARHIVGHPTTRGDVRIGSDVWLAQRATIVSGVTIGDGAVVAANAVVTRDVAPYAIVGGNPAGLIRRRFPEAQIAALLRIRWWDWPDEKVNACIDQLQAGDVAGFIARHDPVVAAAPSDQAGG